MFFLGILGVAILGGMIFLAISHKSDFKVRMAALGALGLMVVSIIVCMLLFVKNKATPKLLLLPDMDIADVPPPPKDSHHMIVMFIILIIALFVMVVVFSLREQARLNGKKDDDSTGWE